MSPRRVLGATVGPALVMALLGCGGSTPPTATPTLPLAAPSGPATVTVISTTDVVTGLATPWGLAFLPDARALVTLRNSGRIMLVDHPGHAVQLTGPGADQLARTVRHVGESGLLGIAVSPGFATDHTVFVYLTRADGNAVMSRSQDPNSLGGKILRITAAGAPAPGNPTPGSPVWTLGHRNVEGIGDGGGRFVRPLAWWPTDSASPSGLAVTAERVYLAALKGERLWRVPLLPDGIGAPQALLVGALGRLRSVVPAPDGSLWLLTNNTDGRGTPRAGDDRIVRLVVG
jgi:glucose/arabinose dehydrogenase